MLKPRPLQLMLTSTLALATALSTPALADGAGAPVASGPPPARLATGIVSPAQLHRFSTAVGEAAVTSVTTRQSLDWDGGNHDESTRGTDAAVAWSRKASPSVYWSVVADRYADEAVVSGDGPDIKSERTLTSLAPAAAYKLMDRVVIGLAAALRLADTDGDSGRHGRTRQTLWQPALAVKSEWYELGVAHSSLFVPRSGGDGVSIYRELLLHAAYWPRPGAEVALIVRDNPLPRCCVATRSHRKAYEIDWSDRTPLGPYQLGATYEPAWFAHQSYGAAYDGVRYGINATAGVDLGSAWTLYATARYASGHTSDAHVELLSSGSLVTEVGIDSRATELGLGLRAAL
jgi:hypothetical protein